jgi:hypothetical protein
MADKSIEERLDIILNVGRFSSVMIGHCDKAKIIFNEALIKLPQRSGDLALLAAWIRRDFGAEEPARSLLRSVASLDITGLSKKDLLVVNRQVGGLDRVRYQHLVLNTSVQSGSTVTRRRI